MDAEFTPTARMRLINTLCRVRMDHSLNAKDMNQLMDLIQLIASDDEEKTSEVDRVGRLAKALKDSFIDDHEVWAFIRWSRPQ